jgi:hypothetical protein
VALICCNRVPSSSCDLSSFQLLGALRFAATLFVVLSGWLKQQSSISVVWRIS